MNKNVLNYVADMKNKKWDWNKSGPLRVMEVDGQLVSYDNRRLAASRLSGQESVPIEIVDPNAIMPGSKKTWKTAFEQRRNMKINQVDGKPVPAKGLPDIPKINDSKSEN